MTTTTSGLSGNDTASEIFSSLANPVRRRLLDLLRDGPRTVNDLVAEFTLSRPAVSEHLSVLRHAGLVSEQARGRQRIYRLQADPLVEVADWLSPYERYWRERLGALSRLLDAEADSTTEPGRATGPDSHTTTAQAKETS